MATTSPPKPLYYAVIFTSVRKPPAATTTPDTPDDYHATAARMFALAAQQPGYLGHDSQGSTRADGSAEGVTVSYWRDLESVRAWRAQAEHVEARRRGREEWYASWRIRVCRVEREYGSAVGEEEGREGD